MRPVQSDSMDMKSRTGKVDVLITNALESMESRINGLETSIRGALQATQSRIDEFEASVTHALQATQTRIDKLEEFAFGKVAYDAESSVAVQQRDEEDTVVVSSSDAPHPCYVDVCQEFVDAFMRNVWTNTFPAVSHEFPIYLRVFAEGRTESPDTTSKPRGIHTVTEGSANAYAHQHDVELPRSLRDFKHSILERLTAKGVTASFVKLSKVPCTSTVYFCAYRGAGKRDLVMYPSDVDGANVPNSRSIMVLEVLGIPYMV